MKRSLLLTLVILCCVGSSVHARNNAFGRPDGNGPVIVDIGFSLSCINDISEEDE